MQNFLKIKLGVGIIVVDQLKISFHLTLNLSVNVVGGLIGGDGFDLTSDYEGRIRDYQLGLEWLGGDYYQGYNEKTDNFDGENFWGLDIGWSGGIPLTIGGIALKSEPLFGMGRIDLTPWNK